MASVGIFGGGFFFAPFSQSHVNGTILVIPGGGFANWSIFGNVSNPTFRARWMQCSTFIPAAAGSFHVQYFLGDPGAEVLWQPTGGSVGAFLWTINVSLEEPGLTYSFPISLEPGQRLTARASTDGVAPTLFNLMTALWG